MRIARNRLVNKDHAVVQAESVTFAVTAPY